MPKAFSDWGTKVKYRVRATRINEECPVMGKLFTGNNHGELALTFVNENRKHWDFFRIIPIGSF